MEGMNRFKTIWHSSAVALICLFSIFFASCDRDDDFDRQLTLVQKANKFVLDYSELYYLWNDKVDYNKSYITATDPFALFEGLVYRDLDQWSYLTDDAETLFGSYEGVETTYGYSLTVINFSQLKEYAAVVNFIYPGSPAEKAGLKRGDIIYLMDGAPITESNYMNLYYSSSMVVETATYDKENRKLVQTGNTYEMSAVKMDLDPVNAYKIIEVDNHKIGYICYTDYLISSHAKMNQVCDGFKSAGVTDVVLDLRYNLGGAANSASYISSLFAPKSAVINREVFLKEMWNTSLTNYWISQGVSLSQSFEEAAVGHNLDLKRIYILTTASTASASEATIVGLKPYMEVITIGEKSHGKYCAAVLLQPLDGKGQIIPEIANWAMSLVAYKYANKDGFTDFTGGLDPVHEVENDIFSSIPFGDTSEPCLAKAIELITGKAPSGTVQVKSSDSPEFDSSCSIFKSATERLNGARGGMVKSGRQVHSSALL